MTLLQINNSKIYNSFQFIFLDFLSSFNEKIKKQNLDYSNIYLMRTDLSPQNFILDLSGAFLYQLYEFIENNPFHLFKILDGLKT